MRAHGIRSHNLVLWVFSKRWSSSRCTCAKNYRCICNVSGDARILNKVIAKMAPGGEVVLLWRPGVLEDGDRPAVIFRCDP